MRYARPLAAACLVALAAPAPAHDGPPYPIFVDERIAEFTLSIWTDPDVGEGTFFYYVEGPGGASPVRIEVGSRPVETPGEEVRGVSGSAPPNAPYQQTGTLPFAHRGTWRTSFRLVSDEPSGTVLGELAYDLDVTPPGLGAIELTWYAVPFLAAGFLWLRIFMAQRKYERELPHTTTNSR